jgi:hypothetical protein
MRRILAGGLMMLLATSAAQAVDRFADVPVIDLRALFDGSQENLTRADRPVRIVGEGASLNDVTEIASESPRSRRAELHAENDPVRVIVVQVDDNLFAIDPFVPIDRRVTEADVRRVFGQRYLTDNFGRSTNRTRFTVRLRSTQQLFRELEDARIEWLRDRGYVGKARTWTRSGTSGAAAQTDVRDIRPSGVIELPADLPRTRSVESVDAGDEATTQPFRGRISVTRVAGTERGTAADRSAHTITRISRPGRTVIMTTVATTSGTQTEPDGQASETEARDDTHPASSTQQERRATRVAGTSVSEEIQATSDSDAS